MVAAGLARQPSAATLAMTLPRRWQPWQPPRPKLSPGTAPPASVPRGPERGHTAPASPYASCGSQWLPHDYRTRPSCRTVAADVRQSKHVPYAPPTSASQDASSSGI